MTNFSSLLMVVGLLSLSACQGQRNLPADIEGGRFGIINGVPVQKKEMPYRMTARILVEQNGTWYPTCTASILAEDLILTAAHCLEYTKANEVRIGFDAQPLSYQDQKDPEERVDVLAKFTTIEVTDFVIHPLYGKSDYDQDMALIRIKGQIPSHFLPAVLLNDQQLKDLKSDQTYQVTLVGFGLVKENPSVNSHVLRQTQVSARFEGFHLITDQSHGSGGCYGDSGGPAYLTLKNQMYLVGVTHGPTVDVEDCHHDGVWGNPSYEKNFLNQSAEKMGSPARF